MTVAKSIAGGLPLSAVVGKAEIMDSPPDSAIGGTYVGNPVAQAAALAVLDVFEEENLVERAQQIGERIRERMVSWQERIEQIGDVRGLGAMLAVEFVRDRDSKEPEPGARDRSRRGSRRARPAPPQVRDLLELHPCALPARPHRRRARRGARGVGGRAWATPSARSLRAAMTGEVIAGRYELEELVGSGGMSTVYRAARQPARAQGRAEDPPPAVRRRRGVRRALPARGACGRAARAPEHRHRDRPRRGRGPPVHRLRVRRGGRPQAAGRQGRAAADRPGGRARPRDRGGARLRARARDRAPRREAAERAAERGPREGDRLRDRALARRRARRHADRHRARHLELHRARAGVRPADRRPLGRLLVRGRPLRAVDRHGALRGRELRRRRAPAHQRARPVGARAPPGYAAQARAPRGRDAREGPRRSSVDGRGSRRARRGRRSGDGRPHGRRPACPRAASRTAPESVAAGARRARPASARRRCSGPAPSRRRRAGTPAPPSPIALEAVGTEDPAGDGEHDGEVGERGRRERRDVLDDLALQLSRTAASARRAWGSASLRTVRRASSSSRARRPASRPRCGAATRWSRRRSRSGRRRRSSCPTTSTSTQLVLWITNRGDNGAVRINEVRAR